MQHNARTVDLYRGAQLAFFPLSLPLTLRSLSRFVFLCVRFRPALESYFRGMTVSCVLFSFFRGFLSYTYFLS